MSLNVKDPEAHRLAQAIAQATGETMTRVHNISINGGRHRPRNSRSHLRMLFLPDPSSGLPIPRYFENVLWLRTGRTRIPFPSLSNNRRSPTRTPRMRRTSRGTVICPLLVILACFCIAISCFLTLSHFPYFSSLTYATIESSSSRELSGVCSSTGRVQHRISIHPITQWKRCAHTSGLSQSNRSEERRVGKECRS